jgi:hypothetical protein
MNTFTYIPSSNRFPAQCGIEVYHGSQSAVVIVTELPDNEGMSICNAFEDLILQVAKAFELDPGRLLWLENWEAWKVCEGAPYDREEEEWIKVEFDWDGRLASKPRWMPVTASFVEAAKSVL